MTRPIEHTLLYTAAIGLMTLLGACSSSSSSTEVEPPEPASQSPTPAPSPAGDDDNPAGDDTPAGEATPADAGDDDATESTPTVDVDGDGAPAAIDCDDSNAGINPSADEVCDGVDNDCDGIADDGFSPASWYADADGDSYGNPSDAVISCDPLTGRVLNASDCDDNDAAVRPDAEEACDSVDNNCDGVTDEGLLEIWYHDQDQDGFGATATAVSTCTPAGNMVQVRGDCNDLDPNTRPGANDAAGDGKDRDCGGTEGPDPHVGLSDSSVASIQTALDQAVDGEVLWVGPGSYLEHDIDFRGKQVSLSATGGAAVTVIDAQSAGRGVIFQSGEDSRSVLDGFTITHAYVSGMDGGGVYISSAGPTITGCIIRENVVDGTDHAGGGLYLVDSSASILDTMIEDNRADYGGGLHMDYSSATIRGCTFTGNSAGHYGGGAYLVSSSAVLSNDVFEDNVSSAYGGGLGMFASSPTVTNCSFRENSAQQGGGLHVFYTSSPLITHCLVSGNDAGANGGGMLLDYATATLTYSVVSDNSAAVGGGMDLTFSSAAITNSVVADNRASSLGGGIHLSDTPAASQIRNTILAYNDGYNLYDEPGSKAAPELMYNDLYADGDSLNCNLDQIDASNLAVEPEFLVWGTDGQAPDYHLALASPLIDVGDPGLLDPDDSPSDIGIFGGANADDEDLDNDGVPAYFWPGTPMDAPEGFDPADYDCDDLDPNVQSCA